MKNSAFQPATGRDRTQSSVPVVWLVDDEVEIAEALGSYLDDKYECQTFPSGSSLLAAIDSSDPAIKSPELIVTDINMPGVDGLQMTRELRSKNYSAPVVVVSGYADRPRVLEAISMQVFAVIDKPFDPSSIRNVLDEALNCELKVIRDLSSLLEKQRGMLVTLRSMYASRFRKAENQLLERGLQLHSTVGEVHSFLSSIKTERELENEIERIDSELKQLHVKLSQKVAQRRAS